MIGKLLIGIENLIWRLFPECTEARLWHVIEERLTPDMERE